ncbi:MAG: diguanylate cyclase [Gammaproteobacteria bacterium]|nr:diguanylate cyclase [Gammaproteobacteria bacterium]MBU1409408.1 diguanylate cyclase [Gammaproteobacteria bacterium]MBU1531322.1 diguanylate cyclase [Gammaproteobacteria bacterium]
MIGPARTLFRGRPAYIGLACAGALALYLFPLRDTPAQQPEIGIAVLAHRGEAAALKNWQATADYLTRTIPTHRFVIVPLKNATLGQAVAEQKVDFVLTNPGSYVTLESTYGVTRMLTMRYLHQGRVYSEFGAVIFTRADRDDIRTLADLEGKTFMGVGKDTFGGFQMAQLELQDAGVDPFKDLKRLEFAGLPQDNIVYAVRDASVDAGTVRTDTLEGMATEGKIDLARFKAIGARPHPGFPFLISTRLYPEWAFARLKHVPEDLAQQVVIALLSLPPDSPAAKASQSAGWTVPLDYTPVHDLFKALRTGPYADHGKVHFIDIVRQYWQWIVGLLVVMALLLFNILYILNLNHHLREIKQRLEASNDELRRLSSHDGLTGVANHRLFEETLASEWARAARDQTPLSLIMADIDHFKLLNDSDGHLAGDECLKLVAQTLDQTVRRPADLLARYGGEEFAAILPGVDAVGALAMAERMRAAVEGLHLPNHGTGGLVTVSLGVVSAVPRPGTAAEIFVGRADHAMYQAKEAGRNQTRLAA